MERLLAEREICIWLPREYKAYFFRLKHTSFASFLRSWLVTHLLTVVSKEKKAKNQLMLLKSTRPKHELRKGQ